MIKVNKLHIPIFLFILSSIIYFIFYPSTSRAFWESQYKPQVYEGNWNVKTATTEENYYTLPTIYSAAKGEQDIWLTKNLDDINSMDCIGFFSFQQQVEVFINDDKVCEFLPEDSSKSSTPGNKWIFVPLDSNSYGQKLTIHIFDCYNKGRITIPTIYVGTQTSICLGYFEMELPHIYVSVIMIFVGVLMGLFHIVIKKNTTVGDSIKWLSLFSIFRGIWGYIEANTYSFFVTRLLLISQLSYLSLKVAATLFMLFLNELFYKNKNKVVRILTYLSISEIFITMGLQFSGIADFASTVYITHTLMIFGGLYSIIDISRTLYIKHKANELKGSSNYYSSISILISTVIIISSSLCDMYRYYDSNSPDVARYCRIGDFLFVLIMCFGIFHDFLNLLKIGQKAAIFKEQASHDAMTNLFNRTQFEKDINKYSMTDPQNMGIIMLDLNNLKQYNDQIGHDAGDKYIISSSETIKQTFASYGKIYRIGGDEFCIISKNLSMNKFIKLRTIMEMNLDDDENSDMSNQFGKAIACGYALYNSETDKSLHDTMKRADEAMYIRKKELKKDGAK